MIDDCRRGAGKQPGCGKVAVYAHLADDTARDKILTALQAFPALLPALIHRHRTDAATGDSEDIGQKHPQIDERRQELAATWAEQEISRKEWAAAKRVLDAKAEQLTRQLARSTHALALAEFAALDGDMWHRWQDPKMTDSARRALIQACVTRDHRPPRQRQAMEPRPHQPAMAQLTATVS